MSSLLTFTNRQQLLRETRDYLFIALGMIMYAVGWTVFLLPNNLPSGAVPGIASVVYWATGFPVQYTYLLINFALSASCTEDFRTEVLSENHFCSRRTDFRHSGFPALC